MKRLLGIPIATAAVAVILGAAPLLANEPLAQICVEPAYAQDHYTHLKIGFSRNVMAASRLYEKNEKWFDEVNELFWEMRLPAPFVNLARTAPDRPNIHWEVALALVYPEMLPLSAVQIQMAQQGIAKLGPFRPTPEPLSCRAHTTMSPGRQAADQIFVNIRSPSHRTRKFGTFTPFNPPCENKPGEAAQRRPDLDFDDLQACRYRGAWDYDSYVGRVDGEVVVLTCAERRTACIIGYDYDAWTYYVSFPRARKAEWKEVLAATRKFLADATVNKSPIDHEGTITP